MRTTTAREDRRLGALQRGTTTLPTIEIVGECPHCEGGFLLREDKELRCTNCEYRRHS